MSARHYDPEGLAYIGKNKQQFIPLDELSYARSPYDAFLAEDKSQLTGRHGTRQVDPNEPPVHGEIRGLILNLGSVAVIFLMLVVYVVTDVTSFLWLALGLGLGIALGNIYALVWHPRRARNARHAAEAGKRKSDG